MYSGWFKELPQDIHSKITRYLLRFWWFLEFPENSKKKSIRFSVPIYGFLENPKYKIALVDIKVSQQARSKSKSNRVAAVIDDMDIWNRDTAFFYSIFCIWKEQGGNWLPVFYHSLSKGCPSMLFVEGQVANARWRECRWSSCATMETSQHRAGIYPLNWITKGRHYVQVNRQHLAWLKLTWVHTSNTNWTKTLPSTKSHLQLERAENQECFNQIHIWRDNSKTHTSKHFKYVWPHCKYAH